MNKQGEGSPMKRADPMPVEGAPDSDSDESDASESA
jgi:hypothetical protein